MSNGLWVPFTTISDGREARVSKPPQNSRLRGVLVAWMWRFNISSATDAFVFTLVTRRFRTDKATKMGPE